MARFQVGNPGSPGRPPKAKEERVLDFLRAESDDDTLTKICKVVIEKVLDGNYRFTELYFGYMIGKPVARIEKVGGNAIEEAMQRWKEMQAQSEQQEIEQMYGSEPENAI